jgi:aryl-alcohol dehydrogenase-like predicted oxidoreductase
VEQRAIGTSGIEVTILGLGTAAFSGTGDAHGLTDDNESIEAIHTAIESGITLFETDPDYGDGHSESLLGKAVRGHRDDLILLSRHVRPAAERPADHAGAFEKVVAQCERTLRRMRCDALDIYAFTPPDPDASIREAMRAMTKLLDRGLIRAIGAANLDMEQLASALEFGPVHCLQTEFSMLHRRAAHDLIPFCVEHDIAVLACGPLGGGVLARPVEDGASPDHRRSGSRRGRARHRVGPAMAELVGQIAGRIDKTPAQLVLNWTAAQPGITSVVFGATRPSQVLDDVGAAGWCLDQQDLDRIQAICGGGDGEY